MLNNYENGYTVMSKDLSSYSFEDISLENCKRYCRNSDVIVERISYKNGINIRIVLYPTYSKKFQFSRKYREFNIFNLHIIWSSSYWHKNGKIVFTNKK